MPLPWALDGPYEAGDAEQTRDTLTRQVLPQSRRIATFDHSAPPPFLGVELGDEMSVTHYGGYDSGGAGWGSRADLRRHVEVTGISWNPGRPGEVRFTLDDLRGSLQRTALETGILTKYQHRLTPGLLKTMAGPSYGFRASVADHEDPGSGLVEIVDTHVPIYSDKGILIQRTAENIVKDSAFVTSAGSGAPWTSTVGGAGGSISNDGTSFLFDKVITANCYKIVSGTGAETFASQTLAVTPAINDKAWISIDHYDPSGTGLYYSIYDPTAVKAWRASDHTWQASATRIWNQLTAASSIPQRHNDYIVFAAANNVEFAVGFPNLGTSKTSYAIHAQVEWGRNHLKAFCPTSRIVTPAGGSAFRGADLHVIGNDTGARTWPATQGTLLWKFVPLWSSANLAGLGYLFELWRVNYDAAGNELISLAYDGDNARWQLTRRHAAANTIINAAKAITAGLPYTGAMRWASNAVGELQDTYGANGAGKGWFDLILDGVRSGAAENVQPTESTLSIMNDGGIEGNQITGYLQWEIVPYVLTETEVARWLA